MCNFQHKNFPYHSTYANIKNKNGYLLFTKLKLKECEIQISYYEKVPFFACLKYLRTWIKKTKNTRKMKRVK